MLAGIFGTTLLIALVVLDWIQFTSLNAAATRYGCRVARVEDRLPHMPLAAALARFDSQGLLTLPHGIARCVYGSREIVLRPQYRLLSQRFRTAWPLKASIELRSDNEDMRLICTKLMPWSSALITLLWFLVVGAGTITFVVSFVVTGGVASLGGVLTGLGVAALGLLVLLFGLVVVSLAYRLEDHRLTQAYHELRAALS
jgi:hypothetical protein